MAPTNHRAQGPEVSGGRPEVTGTRRPLEGTRTPWACAPALTHICLAGAGGWVRTQSRVPGCPPEPCSSLGLCFQGQIQQRPASLQPHACGLQLPIAWGGGGGNNTAGGSSPRSGRCSGCAEATSHLAARVLTMCSLPFCPLCAWGLSSSYEATPTGVDPTPGLIPNSATAGAGLHHMNLAGWG